MGYQFLSLIPPGNLLKCTLNMPLHPTAFGVG
jgi:hypothetical protein